MFKVNFKDKWFNIVIILTLCLIAFALFYGYSYLIPSVTSESSNSESQMIKEHLENYDNLRVSLQPENIIGKIWKDASGNNNNFTWSNNPIKEKDNLYSFKNNTLTGPSGFDMGLSDDNKQTDYSIVMKVVSSGDGSLKKFLEFPGNNKNAIGFFLPEGKGKVQWTMGDFSFLTQKEVDLTSPKILHFVRKGNQLELYTNGQLLESSMFLNKIYFQDQPVVFNPTKNFNGALSNFQIYKEALSPSQVILTASFQETSSEAEAEYIPTTSLEEEEPINGESVPGLPMPIMTKDKNIPLTAEEEAILGKRTKPEIAPDTAHPVMLDEKCPFKNEYESPCKHSECQKIDWSRDFVSQASPKCLLEINKYCMANHFTDNNCICWKDEFRSIPGCQDFRAEFEKKMNGSNPMKPQVPTKPSMPIKPPIQPPVQKRPKANIPKPSVLPDMKIKSEEVKKMEPCPAPAQEELCPADILGKYSIEDHPDFGKYIKKDEIPCYNCKL